MYNILNSLLSSLKNESFRIDNSIPISYLIMFFLRKFRDFICGMIKLKRIGRYFISPSSKLRCVSKIHSGANLNIADHCYIDALSINGIHMGNNVSAGRYTTIECTGSLKSIGTGFSVGNNVGLGTHGFYGCAGGIEIGDDTIIGNYVSFHSENHNFQKCDIPIRLQGVSRSGIKIGRGCWIGAKVTILDGVNIPDGCIIAAGAVVTRDKFFEPYSIIAGVPAKMIKKRPCIKNQ